MALEHHTDSAEWQLYYRDRPLCGLAPVPLYVIPNQVLVIHDYRNQPKIIRGKRDLRGATRALLVMMLFWFYNHTEPRILNQVLTRYR